MLVFFVFLFCVVVFFICASFYFRPKITLVRAGSLRNNGESTVARLGILDSIRIGGYDSSLFDIMKVDGESMVPWEIRNKDLVVVRKYIPKSEKIDVEFHVGDVIVLRAKSEEHHEIQFKLRHLKNIFKEGDDTFLTVETFKDGKLEEEKRSFEKVYGRVEMIRSKHH